jgi:myo-inositol-1(or 4)-monophosphatase
VTEASGEGARELSQEERARLLDIATEITREAGAIAARGWRQRPTAEHKGRIDLVTSFDRASEDHLREHLHARTPYFVVGEEQGADAGATTRGLDRPTWIVDPIDGTTNFVHGHPFYCVSVGLVARGEPILGVVVAPALHTEWRGIVGGGATRNGAACRVSEVDALEDAMLATGFPYDRATSAENNFDAFVWIKKRCQAVRRCGAAAIDLCLVADGTYDGYWEQKLRAWDVAGGAAIVVAAGGRISAYDGGAVRIAPAEAPDPTRVASAIASNGRVHEALVHELALASGAERRPAS